MNGPVSDRAINHKRDTIVSDVGSNLISLKHSKSPLRLESTTRSILKSKHESCLYEMSGALSRVSGIYYGFNVTSYRPAISRKLPYPGLSNLSLFSEYGADRRPTRRMGHGDIRFMDAD
ncbi:hypothetical protein PUN28_013497 [Cardiocondyla obscurior]|uniref:Uncharacterized protein n=1 Tax=Cardiocondyla obscurior TaxID=286306 RepID=A0AAW2F1L2_9HYME